MKSRPKRAESQPRSGAHDTPPREAAGSESILPSGPSLQDRSSGPEPPQAKSKWSINWQYAYALLLLPCVVFTIVFTARAVNWNYTPVPFWDYWDDVASVDQLVRFDPKHFWTQHNEHRILFPEILFALDYRWFSGTEVLPIAASIVCRLTQLLLLLWVLWHTTEIRGPTRLGVAAAVTIFMTSVMQIEAIDSPFLLQWYLSDIGATASLLLLWRAAPPRDSLYALVFSLIAAVIATYSSGNGMIIWPILICLAIYVRFPRTRLAAICLTGTAAVGAYFIHYRWLNQGGLWKLISHPFMTARFVGLYVGAPISYTYRSIGAFIGIGTVLVVIIAVLIAYKQGCCNTPVFFVPVANCLFLIGTAALTACGRMDPADPAAVAATATRYVEGPLGYWGCFSIVLVWAAVRWARGPGGQSALLVLAAVILAVIMPGQSTAERIFAGWWATHHEAGLAMLAGIRDPEIYYVLYPDPGFISQFGPVLQQRRLSIYASGRHLLLGKTTIAAVFGVPARGECAGAAFSSSTLRGGIRVGGWAFDLVEKAPPRRIVLANTSGTIVGLGETRHSGYPSNGNVYHGPARNQWVAFARREGLDKQLQAYALINDDRVACPLGEPISTPVGWWANPEELADLIPVPQWKADPAWTVNGFHPSVGVLSSGTAYGSWSGNDGNTGRIVSSPVAIAGHSCLAVPIAQGPSIEGETVELQDADTGKTLALAPLEPYTSGWRFWAVPLNQPEVKQVRIVAVDNGQGWGQWVAVGQPRWCNPGPGR